LDRQVPGQSIVGTNHKRKFSEPDNGSRDNQNSFRWRNASRTTQQGEAELGPFDISSRVQSFSRFPRAERSGLSHLPHPVAKQPVWAMSGQNITEGAQARLRIAHYTETAGSDTTVHGKRKQANDTEGEALRSSPGLPIDGPARGANWAPQYGSGRGVHLAPRIGSGRPSPGLDVS
jgi:hypothetical protein